MYDAIIFDLDGTLWDASEPCAAGWNRALQMAGYDHLTVTADDIRRVSGMPFDECVAALFSEVPDLDMDSLAAQIDIEERAELHQRGGKLYPGVAKGLPELAAYCPLFLISNCQDWYLERFWQHSGLKGWFRDGDCHGSSGMPKAEMIARMCERHALASVIYIGDTASDQQAAFSAGAAFGLAEYGFGESETAHIRFRNFRKLISVL